MTDVITDVKAKNKKLVKKIGKNEIIDSLSKDRRIKKLNLNKEEINIFIETLSKLIRVNVKKNIKVSLYGLGVFWKSSIKERLGVNPQTGAKIKIGKKKVPRFTASKTFKDWR